METIFYSEPNNTQEVNPIEINEIWEKIRFVVDKVYTEFSIDHQYFIELCNIVRSCLEFTSGNCTSTSNILKAIYDKVCDYLHCYVTHLFQGFNGLGDEDLIFFYNLKWQDYTRKSQKLNSILWSLEAYFKSQITDTFHLCLQIWRNVLSTGNNNTLIVGAILRLIERERDGDLINTHLMSQIVNSYVELGEIDRYNHLENEAILDFYREFFEKFFLAETGFYYQREINVFTMENGPNDKFWGVAQQRLIEERRRAQSYLHKSTEEKLIKICDDLFFPKHIEDLLSAWSI